MLVTELIGTFWPLVGGANTCWGGADEHAVKVSVAMSKSSFFMFVPIPLCLCS